MTSKEAAIESRRSFVRYAAAFVVGAAIIGGGIAAYYASRPPAEKLVEKVVEKPVEKVVKEVKTETVTVAGSPTVVEKTVEKIVTVTPTPTPTPTPPPAAKKITWIIHPVFHDVTGKGELVKRFTEQTKIEVEVISMPYAELLDKIATEFAAGTGRYDVVCYPSEFFVRKMEKYLTPLDDYIKASGPGYRFDDFSPVFATMFNIPFGVPAGKCYGIPARVGIDVLHYRKDLFEQYGLSVPKTMDEYLDCAKKLTLDRDKDGKIDMYGTVIRGLQDHVGVLYGWNAYVGAFNAKAFDFKNLKCTINSPETIEATQFHNDLFQKHKVVPPGVLSYKYDDIQTAINQDFAAMCLMWNTYCLAQWDPKTSKVVGKIGYAPMPKKKDSGLEIGLGTYSGWGFCIDKNSKRKDEAWEFIKFLTNVEGHLYMAMKGNGSPRFTTYENPEYKKVFAAADATREQMKAGRHCTDGPITVQADDLITLFLSLSVSGKMGTKEALDAAYQGLRPLLPEIFGPEYKP